MSFLADQRRQRRRWLDRAATQQTTGATVGQPSVWWQRLELGAASVVGEDVLQRLDAYRSLFVRGKEAIGVGGRIDPGQAQRLTRRAVVPVECFPVLCRSLVWGGRPPQVRQAS